MSVRAAEPQNGRAAEARDHKPPAGQAPPDPGHMARIRAFSRHVADVVVALEQDARPRRIIHQLLASGTAVAANVFEADEAFSRDGFCKAIGISAKDLIETPCRVRFTSTPGRITRNNVWGLKTSPSD